MTEVITNQGKTTETEKIGIVDMGGGSRGIYGAGVFDYCMDSGINFDLVIGVSAGSANGMSYIAGQRGRNYKFYNEYAFRKDYMSFENLRETGSYIGFDYIFSTLSNDDGENPLDFDAFKSNPTDFLIVATDADTGEAVYFEKKDIQRNHYDFLKASSCVPGIDKPYHVGESRYFDGGLSDPLPFRKAFDWGCDRVVVLLTRPADEERYGGGERLLAKTMHWEYPLAAKKLEERQELYFKSLHEAKMLEKAGMVLIVAPDDIGDMKMLSQDHRALDLLYLKGYQDAEAIKDFLRRP